jgi:hypothetical protein
MSNSKSKTVATWLLLCVFFMPLIANIISLGQANEEAQQYSTWQFIVLGFYNMPFFLVALFTWLFGRALGATRGAAVSFGISIVSSTAGSLLMAAWGLRLL